MRFVFPELWGLTGLTISVRLFFRESSIFCSLILKLVIGDFQQKICLEGRQEQDKFLKKASTFQIQSQ